MENQLELQIAAATLRDRIPKDATLTERLLFAMREVRAQKSQLFWMSPHVNDDLMFRTAIAAVMLAGSDEDRVAIQNSLRPLTALSAAVQGVPVDWGALLTETDDWLPLMKLWRGTAGGGARDKE